MKDERNEYKLYRITTTDYVFWYGAFSPAHALQRWFMDYGDTHDEEEIEIERIVWNRCPSETKKAETKIVVSDKPHSTKTVWRIFGERKKEHDAKGDTSKPQFSISTAFMVAWPGDL